MPGALKSCAPTAPGAMGPTGKSPAGIDCTVTVLPNSLSQLTVEPARTVSDDGMNPPVVTVMRVEGSSVGVGLGVALG